MTSLGPLVIGPHLIKGVAYDALKDFDYLSVAVQAPNVLAVPAASPHKSVADVLAFHKANPGQDELRLFGQMASSDHLTAELFWQTTGTSGLHVPYKGGAPAMSDLIGGQVDATFNEHQHRPGQHQGRQAARLGHHLGQALAAAVRTCPRWKSWASRAPRLYSWQAVAAPKGLPADVKARLHEAIVAGLNDPAVKPKLLELGLRDRGQHA